MQSVTTEYTTTFVTPDGVPLSTAVVKKELKELEEFFIPEHRVQVQDPPLGRGGFGIVRIAELLPAEGSQLGAETVVVKELMSDNWNIIPLRAAYVSPTVNDVLGGPTNVRVSTPKRLTREMKVWAKCHHENILKFIGYHLGDDFKPAYLVSEYMRNGNAREYLAKNEVDATGRLELVGLNRLPLRFGTERNFIRETNYRYATLSAD
ncbi:hypothetical protein FRC04_010515 [Tulasnella sp. 424]|nr:hypothetical protein FRC04_010515 [Tulasnella sp. 424]